jgi:hypothetical protein
MAAKKGTTSRPRKPSGWIIVERRDGLEWPTLSPDFATREEAEQAGSNMSPQHNGVIHVVLKSRSYANTPAKKRRVRREVRRSRR